MSPRQSYGTSFTGDPGRGCHDPPSSVTYCWRLRGALPPNPHPRRHTRIAAPVGLRTREAVPTQRLAHAPPGLELRADTRHVEPRNGFEVPPPNRERLDARQARRE